MKSVGDAHLNNVIISEKLDKKAEKLHKKTLTYPYTLKEVFEQSIRIPIGPEFNPVTTVGALIRPEVAKRAGVSIKPIRFQDVNPYEKVENRKRKGQKPSNGKDKSRSTKKMNVKEIKAK
ncbi:U3 small nucleolar RNA-associated 14 homolog A-like isoform X1 [Olea europaea subsp. europaea]|uniref:U3 small nucleolar RNA-associated 14 homolog A-like isoform X1 n=1 Tax=Olea europaea subsp. europaea TaxID=158383 RepID=A0A8S0P7S9_OLEEU|nr:U3 small nucleolar RNA-associated 14 homolog A-like isoform X1 [Olea europaea subsp. europaea]